MGRAVVSEFVTVDGVMEDPGGQSQFGGGQRLFDSAAPINLRLVHSEPAGETLLLSYHQGAGR